jgi:CRP/FNR family transcriptional regulator, anaerobic regulatory protein
MIDIVLQYLRNIYPISAELESDFRKYAIVKTHPPNTFILKEGNIANYACFVIKGLARSYYLKGNGEEVTTKFIPENGIITSIFSFYSRKPGNEYIITTEETTLACFHYNDIQTLFHQHPSFNFIMRVVTENYLYFLEVEVYNQRKQSAEDKYRFFEKHFLGLLQRVPQKYIASYLGITTETLSRIRAKRI